MTKFRLHLYSKRLCIKYRFVKLKEMKMSPKNTERNQRLSDPKVPEERFEEHWLAVSLRSTCSALVKETCLSRC